MNRPTPELPRDVLTPAELTRYQIEFPDRIQRIAAKLERLEDLDRHRQVFGAWSHEYRLAPPCPATRLAAWEARVGVTLPCVYRRFLAEIGDGGAGPCYGIAGLVDVDEHQLERLRRPSMLPPNCTEGDDWEKVEAALPAGSRATDGTMVVGYSGCLIFACLVVHGRNPGAVWVDNTGDWLGPWGAFGDWYEGWLDDSLQGKYWLTRAHAAAAQRRGSGARRPRR